MIGRSGVPTWTFDSARGSAYSGGAFLKTTSRIVSVTVVAPIPPASETMATAAAIGYLRRLRAALRTSCRTWSNGSIRFIMPLGPCAESDLTPVFSTCSCRDTRARVSYARMAAFAQACAVVESVLGASNRRALAEERSVRRLREVMQAHALVPFVPEFDRLGRADGFHALHDWDGIADHVNSEIIPVDVLDYALRTGVETARVPAIAILLDYYLLHVLALMSLRIWDEGNPDENLERLDRLVDSLQGDEGSGHLFVDHAGTLLL